MPHSAVRLTDAATAVDVAVVLLLLGNDKEDDGTVEENEEVEAEDKVERAGDTIPSLCVCNLVLTRSKGAVAAAATVPAPHPASMVVGTLSGGWVCALYRDVLPSIVDAMDPAVAVDVDW